MSQYLQQKQLLLQGYDQHEREKQEAHKNKKRFYQQSNTVFQNWQVLRAKNQLKQEKALESTIVQNYQLDLKNAEDYEIQAREQRVKNRLLAEQKHQDDK